MSQITVDPLQQKVPIVDPQTGQPTPYFLRQMQLLTNNTGVASGEYPSASITVNSNGRITEIRPNGGVVLLEKQVLGVATAQMIFNVPDTFGDLLLVVHGRGDTAANTATMRLQFNADTGNNYYSDGVNRLASVQVAAGAYAEAGLIPAATTTAGRAGVVELTLPDYNTLVFDKEFSYTNYYNSAAVPLAQYGGGHWESLIAITSIRLFLNAGNFDVGTTVSLYGRG